MIRTGKIIFKSGPPEELRRFGCPDEVPIQISINNAYRLEIIETELSNEFVKRPRSYRVEQMRENNKLADLDLAMGFNADQLRKHNAVIRWDSYGNILPKHTGREILEKLAK